MARRVEYRCVGGVLDGRGNTYRQEDDMKVTRFRTALAVLAAAGAVSATGITSAASAAVSRTATTVVQPSTSLPGLQLSAIAPKQGWSSGSGPATDAECQAWAGLMNALIDLALEDLDAGNTVGAANMAAEADRAESDALDRGCVIMD